MNLSAMLAVVRLVPSLVVKRDVLREELTRLRRRGIRQANAAGKRAEIAAEREQLESFLQAGAQAVARLRHEMVNTAALQHPTGPAKSSGAGQAVGLRPIRDQWHP